MANDEKPSTIWLEISNVRRNENGVQVQIKGDRTDKEPVWWSVESLDDVPTTFKSLTEGLDKKRIVLAGLEPRGETLICRSIRIQYAESTTR